jgi:sialate O-acetylesterase
MQLSLASVFTNNMVLQQGCPVPVWGAATPGAAIAVTFRGQTAAATAGADGKWKVTLAHLTASATPAELSVAALGPTGKSAVSITNILTGEVWVCSGQSNMQWSVVNALNPKEEIASANLPNIRMLTVPNRPGQNPIDSLPSGAWSVCSPDTVSNFSAVGYFFGRELFKKLNVPIGLINSSWGGTVAEAWTSKEGLLGSPVRELYDSFAADLPNLIQKQAEWKEKCREIDERTKDTHNAGFPKGWAGVADPQGEWKEMQLPGVWQAKGLNFNGIVWFRKVIDVPASWAGKDLKLSIGATDKADTTYFNNEKMGGLSMQDRPDAWCVARSYVVPGELVKAGRNVIAVRVYSEKYAGGMTGPAEVMQAVSTEPGAKPISLVGPWKYAVEANYGIVEYPPAPMGPDNPNAPTVLYNGMINPLIPYAVRGAIWYQGESNAGRAKQYRTLFPVMIKDWRRAWANDNLAFHFVQLANYMSTHDQPVDTAWAQLREAQTMALDLPHTGMAVTIDIGEGSDIHPRNKQDVGRRLALNALHSTYGKTEVVPAGPLYKQSRREGTTMRLWFDHVGGGLVANGGKLKGFAIAGADKNFVWADAKIDGQTIIVSHPSIKEPTAVRYAWDDNPACNLYNSAGLPASPFRTDPD